MAGGEERRAVAVVLERDLDAADGECSRAAVVWPAGTRRPGAPCDDAAFDGQRRHQRAVDADDERDAPDHTARRVGRDEAVAAARGVDLGMLTSALRSARAQLSLGSPRTAIGTRAQRHAGGLGHAGNDEHRRRRRQAHVRAWRRSTAAPAPRQRRVQGGSRVRAGAPAERRGLRASGMFRPSAAGLRGDGVDQAGEVLAQPWATGRARTLFWSISTIVTGKGVRTVRGRATARRTRPTARARIPSGTSEPHQADQ